MSPADKKWIIYRRGETIGTFTAQEIREDLRKGVLHTTDFAAAEGSAVQLQIIEIDEIFGISGDQPRTWGDAHRRSRWTSRAEELNMESAPATQPRPQPLRRPVNDKPAAERPPQRMTRPAPDQAGHRLWTVSLVAAVTLLIGLMVLWFKRRH